MTVDRQQIPTSGNRVVRAYGEDPRAVICTLATGSHERFLDATAPTIHAYAARHGWSAVVSAEHLAPERPPSWSKLRLVQQLLDEFEFVLWVDADAIVVDIDRCILDEIEHDADIWFARHPQERNPDATVLNAGVLLARSSQFSRDLLGEIWAAERFIDHNWWENAALLDILGYSLEPPYPQLRQTRWNERIGQLSLDWNSVPGYCESEHPAVNHHARADHDSFERRLGDLRSDLRATRTRFPLQFA
jgi:hypothetical protein